MMINGKTKNGPMKITAALIIFIFIACWLFPAAPADAASIGKKKKGYSSKKVAKTSMAKKSNAGAKASKAKKQAAKKSAVNNAAAPEIIEKASSEPAAVDAAAVESPARAVALSSNYYDDRYAEISQKVSEKSKSKKASVKKTAPVALSKKVVISSDEEDYSKIDARQRSPQLAYERRDMEPLAKQAAVKPEVKQAPDGKVEASKQTFWDKYLGNSDSRLKWFPGLYLNIGANVLENPDNQTRKMWSKLGAIPRFSYNDLSFAFDLSFYFDENNNLRKDDWNSFDNYIRKIYYIYYGKPGDRLQARVEMIDDLTLGSGAIFRNYCGSLRYPLLDKKVGGVFTFESGFDDYAKVFVDDMASPGIYAASFEVTPHDHLQLGAQVVSDNKINMGIRNDNITVGSLHVGIPLSTRYNSKIKVYEEMAKIKDHGTGMHTGVLAEMADFIFKSEFRVFSSDYIPNYFDTLYEMERHYKGRALVRLRDNGERNSGWFNELRARVSDAYTFRVSYEKDYAAYLRPHLSLGFDYTGMEYNKLKLSVNYDRKNLYYSSVKSNDAIYGLKARYDISDSSSMNYELRHVLNDYGKPVDSINIDTQLKF